MSPRRRRTTPFWPSMVLLAAVMLVSGAISFAMISCATTKVPAPIDIGRPKPVPIRLVSYTGTVPILSNRGSCEHPVYVVDSSAMVLSWSWTGPDKGSARIYKALPGNHFTFTIPASAETLRVWGSRGSTQACDTMVVR